MAGEVVRLTFPKRRPGPARATPARLYEHTYGPSKSFDAMARDASRRAAESTTDEERAAAIRDVRAFDAQAVKARRLENHRAELARGAAALLDRINAHPLKEPG